MTTKKKMNTYVKYGLTMLICCIVGGVIGFLSFYFHDSTSMHEVITSVIRLIQQNILPIFIILFIISVLIGEIALHKLNVLGNELTTADDDRSDWLEYKMERVGGLGLICNTAIMALSLVLLSTAYSMEYMKQIAQSISLFQLLAACIIFILLFVYNGFWQVRYVKMIQRFYPDKKGDPASAKFQEQWLESCDEAEKEEIYQASYKTYRTMSTLLPILIVLTMCSHLLWNTGIMAVVVVGIVWITLVTSYCQSCIQKKKTRLNT